MRKYILKIFRYPAVDLYMLLGFFVAFTSLFIGLSLYETITKYEIDEREYQCKSIYSGTLNYYNGESDYIAPVNTKARVFLDEVVLSVSAGESEIAYSTMVWLSGSENTYPILEGNWFESNKSSLAVIVGKGIYENGELRIGDPIILEGERYYIQGVVGTKKSGLYDDSIILSIDHMGHNAKRSMYLQGNRLIVESNKEDAGTIYNDIKQDMLQKESTLLFTDENGTVRKKIEQDYSEAIIFFVIYVFALFHCLIVVDVWTHERKYEIAVKKSLGYSNSQLLFDLFKQLGTLVSLAAISCYILQYAVRKIGGAFLGISLELSPRNMLIIVSFVLISTLLCLLVPMEDTRKNNCEILKEN